MRSAALACVALLVCGNLVTASAITRESVVERSKRWVDLAVPYSQSHYFEGYRTDCSGFVSMSWLLTGATGRPISPATDTLPRYGVRIAKDRLLPGDMIVRPKTATSWGHAVIFGGWADEARKTYWAYEQSGSAGQARLRQTPYPYWPSSGLPYEPYRYTGTTEDAKFTQRIAGVTRYSTATAASRSAFRDPAAVDTIVLATGEKWPDALSGSSLAGAVGGPILLTKHSELPSSTTMEISRLAPARVLVLGGALAVDDAVLEQIRALGVPEVERIWGADRYETSTLVAARTVAEAAAEGRAFDGLVYVATGERFPDALAISPVAAYSRRPVVLVRPAELPPVAAEFLTANAVTRAIVLGGELAVGTGVVNAVAELGIPSTRIWGQDAYRTALAVVEHGVEEGLSRTSAGGVTGADFPDALAAGSVLAHSSPPAVLYLVPPSGVSPELYNTLRANRTNIGTMRFYGGPLALDDRGLFEASAALRGW